MRAVGITGVGVLSAAGRGAGALATAIRTGTCLAAIDPELAALGMRARLSARVPDVDATFAELRVDHESFFGRFSRIGAVAALDAMAAAGRAAIGRVLVASAVGPMGELEACFRDTLCGEAHPHRSRAVTRVTPSFLATALATMLEAPRGGRASSSACVSALDALRDAHELVGSGREDAVLVGAVDEDSASAFWAFDRQRLLSTATSPSLRARALSGIPGGFVPAGGAAFFVVEAADAADARGARTLARIEGVTLRSEARPPSLLAFPRSAYRAALEDARSWCRDRDRGPDLVLAHAPPSVADVEELEALDAVFAIAERRTRVRSFKSLIGYALGAAGAIDVALAVHQLVTAEVLPNDRAPLEGRMPRFEPVLATDDGEPVERRPPRRVLKTSYAQGGAAGAILLGAP